MKIPAFLLSIFSFLALASCLSDRARLDDIALLMEPPVSDSNADGFWKTEDAALTGLSVPALKRHILLCADTGATSQVVVYRGRIVSEWYSARYAEPLGAMSSTKVVASILVGQLVDRGLLDYDRKVASILPEWKGGLRDAVTIRQLLTHSAGFDKRSKPEDSVGYAIDKTSFVMALFPDRAPGTRFSYSNEGVQLLEPVIRAITGRATDAYAKDVLFGPLGMDNTALYAYGGGAWMYAEMRTTARDMARLGLMMAQGGTWGDKRIVSETYVAEATRPSALEPRMGYLWWILDPRKTLPGFYASGYLNTDIYVFPAHQLVIVRTQSPREGYSGKPESGDYFDRAQPLFREIVAGGP